MRRFLFIALLALMIAATGGCAQRKIAATPEQPSVTGQTQPDTKAADKQKTTPDTGTSKEAITERPLTKGLPADDQPSLKELQSKIQDVHFDFDKYDVREDGKPILKEVANLLSKNRRIKVIIEGHCDDRGTIEYNLGLGDKRAHSVREHLGSLGIPSSKIDIVSYGKEKPICTEQTEDCWAKNRRAHFVFIEESK